MASLTGKRGIKILHQNVRGLFSNSVYIQELLQNFQNIDILTLSEIHLTQNESDYTVFDIPGYSFISRCRDKGKGGGVAAYISEKTTWERRKDLESEEIECIWIEIKQTQANHPPDSSKYLSKEFNNHLHNMLSKASESSKEVILVGDVNVNYLNEVFLRVTNHTRQVEKNLLGPAGFRTRNLRFTSPMLYQLSYRSSWELVAK